MEMIGNFINNKVTRIKNDRFLENISNLIKEGERQKLDLYRLNNRLKSQLLNCTKLNEILNAKMEVDSIPWRLTEKINENSIGYLTNYRDMKEIDTSCEERINIFNNIVDDISKCCNKISQYNDVIEDIKSYIDSKEMPVSFDSLIKFGFDKNKNLICLLCDFGKQEITRIKSLEVDIFYGKFHENKDYYAGKGLMQLGVHVIGCHPSIEIKVIDVRTKVKRTGIGSFTLKWMEEVIIAELNRRIDEFNIEPKSEEDNIEFYHIGKIYGCSGTLSSDTDSEAREKFYTKNGYIMDGNTFRKILEH